MSDVDTHDVEWVAPFPAGSVAPGGARILAMGGMPGVPNGPTFAYARHVIDVASGTETVLLDPSVDAESATWTPDGTGVLFLGPDVDRPASTSLWLVAPDGSHRRVLWTLPDSAYQYAWHP